MSFARLVGISVAVALLVVGVAMAGAVQDKTVQITDKGFIPGSVEIEAGQKVVFQNATQKDHTVTSKLPADPVQDKEKAGFDSGIIKPGASWEHTFSKEGTYTYSCKEDKSMTGTVVVKPAK